jgi:hypothetical protein
VGEEEIVPSFSEEFHHVGSHNEEHTYQLSDNRYADSCGDWDRPDLRVGRIIGNTADELLIPIMTSINVHRGILTFDRSHALVVTGDGQLWEDAGAQLRNVLQESQGLGPENITMVYTGQIAGDTACEKMQAIGTEVKDGAVDKDIIAWIGHGGPGSWAWCLDAFVNSEACPHPTAMYVEHSPVLGFGTAAAVVFAASCKTGNYEGGRIAEAFLRSGAAAYIGAVATVNSSMAFPFQQQFFNEWTSSCSTGEALLLAKRHMLDSDNPDARWPWWCEIYIWNLYGEPKFGGE